MKAEAPARIPNTATLPLKTEKTADPRKPAIPPSPGRFRRITAVLALAASETLAVPIVLPRLSRTVMLTMVATELGFAIATAVVKLVSSQIGVFEVAEEIASGTTAS